MNSIFWKKNHFAYAHIENRYISLPVCVCVFSCACMWVRVCYYNLIIAMWHAVILAFFTLKFCFQERFCQKLSKGPLYSVKYSLSH